MSKSQDYLLPEELLEAARKVVAAASGKQV